MGFVRFIFISLASIATLTVSVPSSMADASAAGSTGPSGYVNGASVAGQGSAVRALRSAGVQAPRWADESQYEECGQDCLYQKANENISIQALYVVKKMDNLNKIYEGGTDADFHSIVSELQPYYCPDIKPTSVDPDDAQLCIRRYVQAQIPQLRAMRATIVNNEDAVARLQSDQSVTGKASTIGQLKDKDAGKKPQTSVFFKEDELLTTKEGQSQLQLLASENYQQWARQMFDNRPKPEEFKKTESVLSDPKNPNSEKLTRVLKNRDGSPVIDTIAFNAAQKNYNAFITGLPSGKSLVTAKPSPGVSGKPAAATSSADGVDQIPSLFDAHGNFNKDVQKIDPKIAAETKLQRDMARLAAFAKPGAKPTVSALDSVSYNEARNAAVEVSSQAVTKPGVAGEVSFQKINTRAVASAPSPKPDLRDNDSGSVKVLAPVQVAVEKDSVASKAAKGSYVVFTPDDIQKNIDNLEQAIAVKN